MCFRLASTLRPFRLRLPSARPTGVQLQNHLGDCVLTLLVRVDTKVSQTFLIPVCTALPPTTADPWPFSASWGSFTEHLHLPRPDVCDSSNGYEPLWLEQEPWCFYSSSLLPHILFSFFQISYFLWTQRKALLMETGQRCWLPFGAKGIFLPFGDNSDC